MSKRSKIIENRFVNKRDAMRDKKNPEYSKMPDNNEEPVVNYINARKKVMEELYSDFFKYSTTSENHLDNSLVKSYLTNLSTSPVNWDQIIGNEETKKLLRTAIKSFQNKELSAFYNIKPTRGVILYGPPGNGKTMLAKACGTEISRQHDVKEILIVNGPELMNAYFGATEKKIRDIFEYANKYYEKYERPLTIFFDEVDAFLPSRDRSHSVNTAIVAQFLSCLDGVKANNAFTILATNRIQALDEALVREGRFDYKIKVERPKAKDVKDFLRLSFQGIPGQIDLKEVEKYIFSDVHVIDRMTVQDENEQEIVFDFCLREALSGASFDAIARDTVRRAFERDLKQNTKSGIRTQDAIEAIDQFVSSIKVTALTDARIDFAKSKMEFLEQAKTYNFKTTELQ